MDTTHPPDPRVRWLVAGTLRPSPSGQRFLLTEDALAEQLGRSASDLRITVQDRIGASDVNSYAVSLPRLHAFQLSELVDSTPDLRILRTAHAALSGAEALSPDDAAHLKSVMGPGRLAAAMARAAQGSRSPEGARRAALAKLEEALFATARHPPAPPGGVPGVRIPDEVAQSHPLVKQALERLEKYTIDRGTNMLDMPAAKNPEGLLMHLGGHPKYSRFVGEMLDEAAENALRGSGKRALREVPAEVIDRAILEVEQQLRRAIESNSLPPEVLKELIEDGILVGKRLTLLEIRPAGESSYA